MKNTGKTKNMNGLVSTIMANTKKMAINANDFALAKTETVIVSSLEVTAQWQTVADKALKGGLKLADNQQDLVFDFLNEIKGHVKVGKTKFTKFVG